MTTETASAKRQLMPLAWRRAQAVDGSDAHPDGERSLHFISMFKSIAFSVAMQAHAISRRVHGAALRMGTQF